MFTSWNIVQSDGMVAPSRLSVNSLLFLFSSSPALSLSLPPPMNVPVDSQLNQTKRISAPEVSLPETPTFEWIPFCGAVHLADGGEDVRNGNVRSFTKLVVVG